MTRRGATVALWAALTALLVVFAFLPCPAPAQGITTQCIVNVAAQGTSDAITSAQLPCGTTTNLVLLTAAAANTTATPTYAPTGSPPLLITRATGAALNPGDIPGAGYVALLSSTGTSWVLLNPANGVIPQVSTNAILRQYPAIANGVVETAGYYVSGDGGGALYVYSSSTCSLAGGAGDGGSQVPATPVGCWLLAPNGAGNDVSVWGVDMTGAQAATGQTTALQNALNYGGLLVVRTGTVNLSGPVACNTSGTTLQGSGYGTDFVQGTATSDVFQLNTSCTFKDLRINGAQTAGAFVNVSGANFATLQNVYMYGWFTGVSFGGAAATSQRVSNVRMFSPHGSGSTGLAINTTGGSVDLVIADTLVSGAGGTAFLVKDAGDVHLRHVSTEGMANGLAITPSAGQVVQYLDVADSLFDSSTVNGIVFNPAGTGAVIQQVKIHSTWVATSTGIGVLTETTSGGVTSQVDFVDDIIANGATHGFLDNDSGTSNVHFIGGSISGNSGYGAFWNTGATNFSMDGTRIGPSGQFATGNTSGGIALAGSNDYFNIHDLDASGNTGGSIYRGTYTGTHGIIHEVLGYNPIGVTTGTYAPATTVTYTAGATGETHYLSGGVVTAVKVPNNSGTAICTTTPCTVNLGPNETFSVTYTGAPTDTKAVH